MKSMIAVIGGSLRKKGDGTWRTSEYGERDAFGASGTRLRVIAASYVYSSNRGAHVIVSGGKAQYRNSENAPAIATVMKHELLSLGIPARRIHEERLSNNTYEQLVNILKAAHAMRTKKLILISNSWHLPRIQAFLKHRSSLSVLAKKFDLQLAAAEDIVMSYHPVESKRKIRRGLKSAAVHERIINEKKGIRAILKGSYKSRTFPSIKSHKV